MWLPSRLSYSVEPALKYKMRDKVDAVEVCLWSNVQISNGFPLMKETNFDGGQ